MTRQYRHFVVQGQVTDRVDSVDGGAYTDVENAAAQAEVAANAGVPLGDVTVVLGTQQPPTAQMALTPDPVAEVPPTKFEQVLDILAQSKTLAAEDKAALEALRGQ